MNWEQIDYGKIIVHKVAQPMGGHRREYTLEPAASNLYYLKYFGDGHLKDLGIEIKNGRFQFGKYRCVVVKQFVFDMVFALDNRWGWWAKIRYTTQSHLINLKIRLILTLWVWGLAKNSMGGQRVDYGYDYQPPAWTDIHLINAVVQRFSRGE